MNPTTRQLAAQDAHTKLIRIEGEIRELMRRLDVFGFKEAADALEHVCDYHFDAVREAIGSGK